MPSYFSYATVLEPQPVATVVAVDGPDLELQSETMKVSVQRQPLRIAIHQHTGDRPEAPLELHVFPGEGCSWLYEDDGESLGYRQGDFRLTRFDMQQSGDHVEIIRTVEGRFQPAYRQVVVCLHGGAVASATIDGRELDLEVAMAILPADGWRRLQIYVTASPI